MPDKFTIDPARQKIIVEITEEATRRARRSNEELENPAPVLGMLPGYVPRNKRRFRKIAVATLLNFHDAGFLGGASLMELVASQTEITLADYSAMVEYILNFGLGEALNVSSIIEDYLTDYRADGYFPFGISLAGETIQFNIYDRLRLPEHPLYNEKWKPNGLELTDSELAQIMFINAGDMELILPNPYGIPITKITSVNDYSAPAVAFALSKKMDFYIMPRLYIHRGESAYNSGNNLFVTNLPAKKIPAIRELNYKGNPYFRKWLNGQWLRSSNTIGQEQPYASAYSAALTSAGLGFGGSSLLTAGFTPPPGLPPQTNPAANPQRLYLFYNSPNPNGRLQAIVKKGGETFYVWKG